MSETTWGVYKIQGKLPDGTHTTASDKRAVKWFVRWRVNNNEHKRTLSQKGHAKTFRDRLLRAQVLGEPADHRGYPAAPQPPNSDSGASVQPAVQQPTSITPRSRPFEDYCLNVWWPTIEGDLGERNRAGHRKNMRDAIKWLRYREGDPRIATLPGTNVGDSILLIHLNADDVKHALVQRRNHNDRTAGVNNRRLARAIAGPDPADIELPAERASDRTVNAFKVTLGMIVNAADHSKQADRRCLEGSKGLAPRPRTESASRRVVPSVDEIFALSAAIAAIGPIMDNGKPAGDRFAALILAAGTLGPRPGELVAHRPHWRHVEKGTTYFRFHRTEAPFYDKEAGVAGRLERGLKHRDEDDERLVPALPAVTAAIERHLAAGYGRPDRTFASVTGRAHLDWSNILKKYWYPACDMVFADSDKPSLATMPPKTLRKAAITFWLDSGVSAALAAEWAGHSEEVAQRYYAGRVDPGFAREIGLLAQHASSLGIAG